MNFEVNALLIQTHSVQQMVNDYERDLHNASLIVREEFMKKRLFKRLMESLARLLSPLL